MIIIPTHILNSGLSSDEIIEEGRKFTESLNNGDLKPKEIVTPALPLELPLEAPIKKKDKGEDWNDPDVGVLVGPAGRKQHRLNGGVFKVFMSLYTTYGNKNGKRNAAWAFYSVIVPILRQCATKDDMSAFSNKLLKAARAAAMENEEMRLKGSTPQYLQGWITNMKWEDYD